MKTLKDKIDQIVDLRVQRDRSAYWYYNRKNQTILLNMIIEEMKGMNKQHLSNKLYIEFSNPERLANTDIEKLCQIFKQTIIEKMTVRI